MTQRNQQGLVGSYANFLVVGHNAFEFILDFGQGYGVGAPNMHMRVVTTPVYAKAMLEALRTSIERFETQHGEIPDAEEAKRDGGDPP